MHGVLQMAAEVHLEAVDEFEESRYLESQSS